MYNTTNAPETGRLCFRKPLVWTLDCGQPTL